MRARLDCEYYAFDIDYRVSACPSQPREKRSAIRVLRALRTLLSKKRKKVTRNNGGTAGFAKLFPRSFNRCRLQGVRS